MSVSKGFYSKELLHSLICIQKYYLKNFLDSASKRALIYDKTEMRKLHIRLLLVSAYIAVNVTILNKLEFAIITVVLHLVIERYFSLAIMSHIQSFSSLF